MERPSPNLSALVWLPSDLQLRILEQLSGLDLCAVECSCSTLRRLMVNNSYLYKRVLALEYDAAPTRPKTSWKHAYMSAFVQTRLDELEGQRRACEALKLKLDELDGLLHQADDVTAALASPELLGHPALVLTLVDDMKQDVQEQRSAACRDFVAAEAQVAAMEEEVQALLARVPLPPRWRNVHAIGCTIA